MDSHSPRTEPQFSGTHLARVMVVLALFVVPFSPFLVFFTFGNTMGQKDHIYAPWVAAGLVLGLLTPLLVYVLMNAQQRLKYLFSETPAQFLTSYVAVCTLPFLVLLSILFLFVLR